MIYSLGADFSPSNGIILGEAFFLHAYSRRYLNEILMGIESEDENDKITM